MEKGRVVLTLDDFRALVRGEVVKAALAEGGHVKVALADIGWDAMAREVRAAATESTNM